MNSGQDKPKGWRPRWSVFLLGGLCLLAVTYLVLPAVTVTNGSTRAFRTLKFMVVSEGDGSDIQQEIVFMDLAPSVSRTARFTFKGDCVCCVDVEFDDGDRTYGGGGYLTTGLLAERLYVTVLQTGEVEVQRSVTPFGL